MPCRAARATSRRGRRRRAAVWLASFALLLPSLAAGASGSERDEVLSERDARTALLAYFDWRAEAADESERYLDELLAIARDARSPLARAQATFDLARARARAGELEAALELDRELGLVQDAWLLGPLPKEGALLSEDALPFEQPFSPDARTMGIAREVGFTKVKARAWLGGFDLDSYLEPDREVGAVLVVGVRSDRAQPAAVRVGSSAPVVVRMNGAELARDLATRELRPDQTSAAVNLTSGMNLLVVRAWSYGGALELSVRLTAPDGGPLRGVRYSTDPQALASAPSSSVAARPVSLVDPVAEARSRANADGASLEALREGAALARSLSFGDERAPVPLEVEWLMRAVAKAEVAGTLAHVDEALAADHLRLGELLRAKDPSAAHRHLTRAIVLGGDAKRAHLTLASLLAELGLVDAARREHEAARALAPDDPEVSLARLELERTHGHLRSKWGRLAFRLADESPTSEHLEVAAEIARELGDTRASLDYLGRLAEREPGNPSWVFARVRLLENQLADSEDPAPLLEEIVALLSRRLAYRPESHHTARELAMTLFGAGREEEAARLVDERLREFPARLEPLRLLAELRLLAGERDAAREALAKALALRPQHRRIGALYRALSDEGGGLAARYGVEPLELPRQTPNGAREVGAHVVSHTVAIRFHENGLGQVLTDRVLDVHDAGKAEGLRMMTIPFSEGREVVEVLRAERITADGRREPARDIADHAPDGKQGGVYTDVRYKVVTFADLAPGDRLHLRVLKHLVGQQNLFGDFFGHIEALGSAVPVERWRLVVEAPRSRALAIGGRGAPEPEVYEPEDRPTVRVYELTAKDLPRVVLEPGMPPFLDVASYVSLSTYDSWSALGDWYAELVREQLVLDAELKALARELVKGARDDEEKVRRVYEHVVTSTRYVGIELGIHGWKPYPVTEVYRRRYGDCKDKASLLVALLEEVGIEARLALVRTADNGVLEDEPASMWAFNHAIAYVPSLDLFLDGTAERSGYRELPDMNQGAMSLIVKKPGSDEVSRLVRIPLSSPDENLNTSRYELTLREDGSLEVRGEERFRGARNAEQRRSLIDEATRAQELERLLTSILPGTRVHRVTATDLSLGVDTVGYDFEATIPNRALPSADGDLVLPLSLYPHGLAQSYAERSRRQQAVWVTHPWRIRNVMRYRVPAGFVVVDLPESRAVEGEHLSFEQLITPTEDGFIVDENTAIHSRLIPVEDYAALRETALAADAMMKRKVRLRRRAP